MNSSRREPIATGPRANAPSGAPPEPPSGPPVDPLADAPSGPPADPLADLVLDVVTRTARRVHREMRRHVDPDVTVSQSRALRYIGRHPGTDLSDVAAFLGMTMPSASALVTRLERAGQIVRSTDPAERRRLRLELTPDGAAVVERILGETRTWLATELRRLSADERRRLSDGVAVLAAIGEGAGSRR